MTDSLRDRYLQFIDQVITDTLKGKFRSKRQVYDVLAAQLELGTSEIFERCLGETVTTLQEQSKTETDELKQAKLTRKLRAIKTLESAWADWQKQNQSKAASANAVQQIVDADTADRLAVLIDVLDANRGDSFNRSYLNQLSKELSVRAAQQGEEGLEDTLKALAEGLKRGTSAYEAVEDHLISWMYDRQRQIGFGTPSDRPSPWKTWAKHTTSPFAKAVFMAQTENQSAATVIDQQGGLVSATDWVELAVLMQGLQRGLVAWFDSQPYNLQAGQNLAGMTFLAFTIIWGELSKGCAQSSRLTDSDRQSFSRLCFAISLQILRTFAQRQNFPLYGGVFTSFSGEGFRDAMTYLDQPLRAVEATQEKARILTVLGYSQRWMNRRQEAAELHQEALDLAQEAGDAYCVVANLNHLSRLMLQQKDYGEAIDLAQRALIVARSGGDRQGEANALVSVGYSEVMRARQSDALTMEQMDLPLSYLQQGKALSAKQEDLNSQALCCVGLGIAYISLGQAQEARQYLETGVPLIQQIGDVDLRALTYAFLGDAYYQLEEMDGAVVATCLGMYWLHERGNDGWRQAAALATIIQGQLGNDKWEKMLQQYRSKVIAQIGTDGFDYLPQLIEEYRER